MPSTFKMPRSAHEGMRFNLIQTFSYALAVVATHTPGDDEAASVVRTAFDTAKKYGWDWTKDGSFELFRSKSTEQEILAEGLMIALHKCQPEPIPAVIHIPEEFTGAEFADFLWTLHCELVGDSPGTEIGRRSYGGPDADILESFASFASCAAEDGLWVEDAAMRIGNDQDTIFGLLAALRGHVIRATKNTVTNAQLALRMRVIHDVRHSELSNRILVKDDARIEKVEGGYHVECRVFVEAT